MKRKLLFLIVIMVATVIFAVSASGAELKLGVELDNGTTIRAVDDIIYLPSYVDIHDVKITYISAYKNITLDGKAFTSGEKVDLSKYLKRDADSRATYYELTFMVDGIAISEDKVYIYKSNNLPAIFVNSSIGDQRLIELNQVDSNATVSLIDKRGSSYVNQTGTEVRTRGNTTDTYAKKPFQIKFSSKIDLYGMGKAKTWVLLANYLDQSYIRNSVMYKLAKSLGMNASDFQNVELYIDGKYQGIYLLCEKVNINASRVNITELEDENEALNPNYGKELMSSTETVVKDTTSPENNPAILNETIIIEYKYVKGLVNPADITGGYLIELDNNNKDNRDEFGSYFITKTSYGENLYVIKSPEYCSKEQVEYIARRFAEMEEAMASSNGKNSLGKHYTEYMDIDTFAVAYIMAELGRNYDVGGASIYFYKDADKNGEVSKIIKGPLWDCDNVLGNIHRGDAQVQNTMWATKGAPWKMLTRQADFNAKVKEKFEIAYDIIYDMLDKDGFIDQQIKEIGYSAKMDRLRWKQDIEDEWPLYADGTLHWFNKSGKTAFPYYATYTDYVNNTKSTAIGYLCLTLQERTEYLATTWGCEVTPRTRTLNDPLPPITSLTPEEPGVPTPEEPSDTPEDTPQAPEQTPNENETLTTLLIKMVEAIIELVNRMIEALFTLG